MENNEKCLVCGESGLTTHYDNSDVEYRGVTGSIQYVFCRCDSCGAETAGKNELKMNKRSMIAFRKQVDGLLAVGLGEVLEPPESTKGNHKTD